LPLLKMLSRLRGLRGTAFDPFGRTAERRLERELITDYESRIAQLLPLLDASRLELAVQVARVPLSMRGFGHVKQANVVLARAREAELLHRFDPSRFAAPAAHGRGRLDSIAVVAA
jgi:indolepyruvate ferredoxin oxidoreductase